MIEASDWLPLSFKAELANMVVTSMIVKVVHLDVN